MILFGIDVTIMQAGYKSNKKFVISENIDIINFMKNYQPNCGGTFLAESFKEIPKNSFVYIYSDFYLDRIDEECIDEFKNRFLVSKTDNTYSIYKNEINFL